MLMPCLRRYYFDAAADADADCCHTLLPLRARCYFILMLPLPLPFDTSYFSADVSRRFAPRRYYDTPFMLAFADFVVLLRRCFLFRHAFADAAFMPPYAAATPDTPYYATTADYAAYDIDAASDDYEHTELHRQTPRCHASCCIDYYGA